jgi:hypothetical protein
MSKRIGWTLAACAVLLLAWGLFLVGIDDASMWFDDDYSWRISRTGPISAIQSTTQDVHPPVYYLLLWGWMSLTGNESLLVLRLPSTFAALLTVAVAYRLGWLWFRSGWAGLAAAVFLSGSGLLIYYARIVRMYGLIVLLVALSWWALTRLLQGKHRAWIAYGLSLAAMAWTFYFAAFVVLVQVLVTVFAGWRRWRQVLLAYGLALILFAPWLPVFVGQVGVARAQSGDADAPAIGKFLGTIPTGPDAILAALTLHTNGQPAYLLLLLILGTWAGWRNSRRNTSAAMGWFLGTIGVLFALNLVIPVYSHRYTVLAVPGLALLVGLAVIAVRGHTLRIVLLVGFAVVGILTYPAGFTEDNVPHRELFQTIEAGFREGDRIWYNMDSAARGSSIYGAPAEYHLLQDAPSLDPEGSDFVWSAPADYRDQDIVARVWDVRPVWNDPLPDALRELEDGRAVTESYVFGEYRLRLYETPPADETVAIGDALRLSVGPSARTTYTADGTVLAKLWWTTDASPSLDYSRAIQLRDASGEVIAQADDTLTLDPQAEFPLPTSQWGIIENPVYVSLLFDLPTNLPPDDYSLWMIVYHWETPDAPLMVERVSENETPPPEDTAVQVAAFTVR